MNQRKIIVFSMLFAGMFCCFGCKNKEPVIENLPVDNIAPSEPPAFEAPVKNESPYGGDGIYKVSDKRYFGAVIPRNAVEISCENDSCSFYVPNMMSSDIKNFLAKYYPYQKLKHFGTLDVFELSSDIKPEFADDAIVPELDPNVVKPIPESAVEIKVYWNKRENRFVWVYYDPMIRLNPEPDPVPDYGDEIPPCDGENCDLNKNNDVPSEREALDMPEEHPLNPGPSQEAREVVPNAENVDIIPMNEERNFDSESPNLADELNKALENK